MRYRRQEAFRYQFESPVVCTFRIIKVEGKERVSNLGDAHIFDISEGGLKLITPFNLPLEKKQIEIEVDLTLNKTNLLLTGILVWKKEYKNDYSYGIHFTIDEQLQKQLIQELKIFSRGTALIRDK